jgi:hypothetical protein
MSTQQQPVGMSDELNAGGCVEDQIVERQKRGPKEAPKRRDKAKRKDLQNHFSPGVEVFLNYRI